MTNNTNIDENIEGVENLRAWQYIFIPTLEEHDLDCFIKEDVKEPKGEEAKAKHKKDMIKVKRIITISIKDQFISQVYSKNTQKEMFYRITYMFEGKNINKRTTLRNQLKGVKIHLMQSIQSYFLRVSRVKEQLESIGDMFEE